MKPIIFSTEMVQAILEGRKTQTRRVIRGGYMHHYDFYHYTAKNGKHYKIPYFPGDILWVRETWSVDKCDRCLNGSDSKSDFCSCEYVYRTNYGITEDDSFPPSMFKWRPSIHMPSAAARIFLRVTGMRVNRLQDISEADAINEGVEAMTTPNIPGAGRTHKQGFGEVWNSLNAKRGYGWDTNCWVWVYEFEHLMESEASI